LETKFKEWKSSAASAQRKADHLEQKAKRVGGKSKDRVLLSEGGDNMAEGEDDSRVSREECQVAPVQCRAASDDGNSEDSDSSLANRI
jgi:hypothetical protein